MTEPSRPVFIVGSPRTGSSVLHWSLCQSAEFWGSSESDFLHELAPATARAWERGTRLGEFSWLVKEKVSEAEFYARIGAAVDELFQSRAGGACWIDQTPYYVHIADHLLRLFPGARFLVLFRDGRNAVPSIQSLLGRDFAGAVAEWREATGKGLSLLRTSPGRCHPVCFEDLVLNTETCLVRVFEFLEADFCPASARFVRERDPINTSFEQESSRDKVNPRWLDWGAARRKEFESLGGGLLQALGYEADARWVRRGRWPARRADPTQNVEYVVGRLDALRMMG